MPHLRLFAAYLQARSRSDEGATAVEYGLLVSLIAIVMIVGVTAFGNNLSSFFSALAARF